MKDKEPWAIITITKKGINKALEIQDLCPEEIFHIYTLEKYKEDGVYGIHNSLKALVEMAFTRYRTIVFIMAAGIVVRIISPLLQSKLKDPAVLIMDDKGQYVISLLSGHIGGGNKKTIELAKKINALPVITTASDTNGKIAVDTMAMKYELIIENMMDAKNITAMMVNEEPVAIINESAISVCEDLPVISKGGINETPQFKGFIYISPYKPENIPMDIVHLIPMEIIIGIGCRRGIEGKEIIDLIRRNLEKLNIHPKALCKLSTVEIKKNENGIIEASEHFKTNLEIITLDEIKQIENQFIISPFVKKSIGVGNVCEPCGYISSDFGECLLPKTAENGITISIWKKN